MQRAGVQERPDGERLRVLRATGLLDAGPVPSLDRLTALAARLLDAPAALVSLVDADRQRFASACGLSGELAETRQTPLTHSYCRFVVEDEAPLIVADARLDPRLRDSPAITDYAAIAYAGMPLRSPDGYVLGSFCVSDSRPRDWTEVELSTLRDLALAAESEVALRLAEGARLLASERLRAVLDSTHDAYVSIGTDGLVIAWNAAAEQLFGYTVAEATDRPVTELIIPARYHEMHRAGLARVRDGRQSALAGHRLQLTAVDRAGREFPAEMTLQVSVEREELTFHAFVHDVTGRMVARAEMDRQRQTIDDEHIFLQALLDNLDAGVAACDSDGNLTFFNRAMRDVHGPDATMYDLYAPDGHTLLREEETPLVRAHNGEIVRGQQVAVRTAGEPRRYVSNARPIDTADGRRLGAVVALHDITDAYRAESLQNARHAVAQVLSEATNAEQAGIGAVAAIADALGWLCGEYWQVTEDRQEIVRLSSRSSGTRDISAFTSNQPLTFARGEGLPGVVWMRGTDVWSSSFPDDIIGASRLDAIEQVGIRTALGLPVRSGRRVLGVLAFYTDTEVPHTADIAAMLDSVSAHLGRFVERRRAEDLTLALSAARREFDRVVEQVNDYVWTVEAIPGEPGRLVYGSPNATGVFGVAAPGQATAITDRIHPEDADKLTAFHGTLAVGRPAELECRILGYDHVVRWVWTRAVPRREGSRLFIDGISTNVNERRELDEQREEVLDQQRRQVEQLRELDRMKDELSALVIHELRNPVGVIRGYTEMLLDSPHLDETDRRHAGVVDRSTLHLQRLVDDLLDLARLDAGHISIDPRQMPAGRLIRDVLENHRPSAAAKCLTITERLEPDLPVHADAQRLRQALDNLLSNAIKYTPEGGTVTVGAERRGESVAITVRDTGIGIPPEQYRHLFSRFFRASNATKKGIKGTGLGLAVTKAIVEAHEGTLTAAPAEGGGTTFTLLLPAQQLASSSDRT